MDRLLSDAEVCKICRSGCDRIEATQCDWRDKDECHNLIVAQLAKTDKEWLEWLLENLFRETDYGLEWQSTPRVALKRLAERKLEIGI